VFEQLLDEGLLEMIRENRTRDVDGLLKDVLGNGYTWKELMRVDELSGSLASA
jgi:hypothetical protein